jgi:hypothetical protein
MNYKYQVYLSLDTYNLSALLNHGINPDVETRYIASLQGFWHYAKLFSRHQISNANSKLMTSIAGHARITWLMFSVSRQTLESKPVLHNAIPNCPPPC